MKKILILANNDVGLYKFRKELIQELLKENEVYISLPQGDYVEELKAMGCVFINTKINRRGTNPITDLILLKNYLGIIKKVKPSIVLTYTIKPNVYGGLASRIMKIPYIANVTGLGTSTEKRGLLQTITLNLYKVGLKKAKCVFFQNKENEDLFTKRGIVKGNKKIIPGSGVNLEEYSILNYPAEGEFHFLFISRVMKEKGIEQYLDAAKYFKNNQPKTIFHVLGFCEGNYEEKLKSLHGEGVIRYHGMQSNVREFHEISHCTIHPTYYPEGMSNVLLESAASGRPIITTDRSGCREIVDDGVNGYVVEQENSADLIEKIQDFLRLPHIEKENMGINGRKKVERKYDRQIVVNYYMEQIQNEMD